MSELRYYQHEAIDAFYHSLNCNAGHPVICIPTGGGKSHVIAGIIERAISFGVRVMVLAHRKELLEQNFEKTIAKLAMKASCGIYSAGLRRYAMDDAVIFAGIQSVFRKAHEFGRRHLVLIDEVHLVPDENEGMYRKFLGELENINKDLKIGGLTATPYRTSTGSIVGPGKLFSTICYTAKISRLMSEGYLSPVVAPGTKDLFDTSKLHLRGGEFIAKEVETLFDDDGKTFAACSEIVAQCQDRKSILLFSSGVQHAEHIASVLSQITGERCQTITGETEPLIRSTVLSDFKHRRLRWLVNVDVLTTGFDAPCVDAIAVLRATHSPGLFAQICGRGFRLFDGKENCLILDYGNNVKRHGPIDSDSYGEKKQAVIADKPKRTQPEGGGHKECPSCGCWVPNSTKVCPGDKETGEGCGFIFAAIEATADTSGVLAKPEKWLVIDMHMNRHRKKGATDAPDTLRVSYEVVPHADGVYGNMSKQNISEWICLEHDGFAGRKAYDWLAKMTLANLDDARGEPRIEFDELGNEVLCYPISPIDAAIDLFNRGAFAKVHSITTIKDGRWDRITNREIGERPTVWQEPVQPGEAIGFDEWGQPIYEEAAIEFEHVESEDLPF